MHYVETIDLIFIYTVNIKSMVETNPNYILLRLS